MACILRRHLTPSEAHILAGSLAAGGIEAAVTGELSAQVYGVLPAIDCALTIREEDAEEAEAYLRAPVTGEMPPNACADETCPPNGDPPGILTLLYMGLWVALVVSTLAALWIGSQGLFLGLRHHSGTQVFSNLGPAVLRMMFHFFTRVFIFAAGCTLVWAIGAGLLLHIIRGYRRNFAFCNVIVTFLLLYLVVVVVMFNIH